MSCYLKYKKALDAAESMSQSPVYHCKPDGFAEVCISSAVADVVCTVCVWTCGRVITDLILLVLYVSTVTTA